MTEYVAAARTNQPTPIANALTANHRPRRLPQSTPMMLKKPTTSAPMNESANKPKVAPLSLRAANMNNGIVDTASAMDTTAHALHARSGTVRHYGPFEVDPTKRKCQSATPTLTDR